MARKWKAAPWTTAPIQFSLSIIVSILGTGFQVLGQKIAGVILLVIGFSWLWWLLLPWVSEKWELDQPRPRKILWGGWTVILVLCRINGWLVTHPNPVAQVQVSSTNQSGGITASNVIIHQHPPGTKPQVKIGKVTRSNVKTEDGYETVVPYVIESSHPVGKFRTDVCGRTLKKIHLVPNNMGIAMKEGSEVKNGCAFDSIQNASGTFKLILISSEPFSPTNKVFIKPSIK